MNYYFSAASQALLHAGKVVQAHTADGTLLPILRDVTTGRIVEVAKATAGFSLKSIGDPAQLIIRPIQMLQTHLGFLKTYQTVEIAKATAGFSLESIAAPAQLIMGPIQMIQTHRGFQKTYQMLDTLQRSVAVLQGTTAVIGVGTFAGVALSGVNLYQTLKIRKSLQKLDQKIDLKIDQVLDKISSESEDIKQRIDQVAQDVEFKIHRTILDQAYGRFQQSIRSLKNILEIQDSHSRLSNLVNIYGTLNQALADYKNPQIYNQNTNAPGRLRRYECAWQMEQAMAMIFIWKGEFGAASSQMQQLRDNIDQDIWDILSCCESEEELDFIYPELMRIHTQDLPAIAGWHAQVDYLKTAPKEELEAIKNLVNTEESPQETLAASPNNELIEQNNELIEQTQYEQLKNTSHFLALRDHLKFTINPQARQNYESYISARSPHHGYRALAASNWQEISDITVANLYWYLKSKDKDEKQTIA